MTNKEKFTHIKKKNIIAEKLGVEIIHVPAQKIASSHDFRDFFALPNIHSIWPFLSKQRGAARGKSLLILSVEKWKKEIEKMGYLLLWVCVFT